MCVYTYTYLHINGFHTRDFCKHFKFLYLIRVELVHEFLMQCNTSIDSMVPVMRFALLYIFEFPLVRSSKNKKVRMNPSKKMLNRGFAGQTWSFLGFL